MTCVMVFSDKPMRKYPTRPLSMGQSTSRMYPSLLSKVIVSTVTPGFGSRTRGRPLGMPFVKVLAKIWPLGWKTMM